MVMELVFWLTVYLRLTPPASLESLFSVPVACLIQGAFSTKSHQPGLALGARSNLLV